MILKHVIHGYIPDSGVVCTFNECKLSFTKIWENLAYTSRLFENKTSQRERKRMKYSSRHF